MIDSIYYKSIRSRLSFPITSLHERAQSNPQAELSNGRIHLAKYVWNIEVRISFHYGIFRLTLLFFYRLINNRIMNPRLCLLVLTLLVLTHSQSSQQQKRPCVAFQGGTCTICPYEHHIYQEECYANIQGCLNYTLNQSGSQQCAVCDPTVAKSDGKGGCLLTMSLYELAMSGYFEKTVKTYGDLRFQPLPPGENPSFNLVNNYMLNGDYRHFISRSAKPVQWAGQWKTSDSIEFKIIYQGSGGGLMLCLISLDSQSKMQLRSFVIIGGSGLVPYCLQYDVSGTCSQCQQQYHLQGGKCYPDLAGCMAYYQNICLKCSGYALLIENRCVTTCQELADLNIIRSYGDFRTLINCSLPSISRSYLL